MKISGKPEESGTDMEDSLFREKTVKRISSPEDLSNYLHVTRPSVWLILAAVILMLLPAVPAAGTATASAQPVLIGPTYAMLNTEYTWTLVQPPTGSVS